MKHRRCRVGLEGEPHRSRAPYGSFLAKIPNDDFYIDFSRRAIGHASLDRRIMDPAMKPQYPVGCRDDPERLRDTGSGASYPRRRQVRGANSTPWRSVGSNGRNDSSTTSWTNTPGSANPAPSTPTRSQ